MNRKALARHAYNTACDRALATLSGSAARAKLEALRNAYEARKSQIDLASFIGFHGLDRVLGNMAREHREGRIGDQLIHRIHPTSEQKAHLEAAVAVLRGTHVGEQV